MTDKEFIEKWRRAGGPGGNGLSTAFREALDRLESAEKESEALLTLVKTAPAPEKETK